MVTNTVYTGGVYNNSRGRTKRHGKEDGEIMRDMK